MTGAWPRSPPRLPSRRAFPGGAAASYARAAEDNAQVPVDAELVPALFRTCRHSMKAAHLHLEPYAGDITFLRAGEQQSFGVTGGVGHLAEPFWADTCLAASPSPTCPAR